LTQALSGMFSVYQVNDLSKMERMMAMLKPSVLFIDQALTKLDGGQKHARDPEVEFIRQSTSPL
jgi:hypothetical protein